MWNRWHMVALASIAGCSISPVTFLELKAGTVTVTRTGVGTITSSPEGIDCGETCSHVFPEGTQVTLTAAQSVSSAFTGWSGACAGTDACVIDVVGDGEYELGAMFASVTLDIALAGDSTGTVISDPAGISCGPTCSATFAPGSTVRLTASPTEVPSAFAGWSLAACADTGPCTLTLTEATTSLTATFTRRGSTTFTTSGTFMVPPGVSSVRVLAVGGGAGGANGHQGGGGSGLVATGTLAVSAGDLVPVTVGGFGKGANPCNGCNDIIGNTPGGASSFGTMLSAAGGQTPTVGNGPGGNGGSGGGGSCNAGPVGGAGGTSGAAGGACSYAGGTGQGSTFTAALSGFTVHTFTAGPGGAGGTSSHAGGGGGGGVRLDNAGPSAGNGAATFSGKGGGGFGAGGGGGGFNDTSGPVREAGGNGAPGLVYVEW